MLRPYYEDDTTTIYCADNREVLPGYASECADLIFTSPPYNLRQTTGHKGAHRNMIWRKLRNDGGDYGGYSDDLPYGEYVAWQQSFLRECWRLLAPAGAIFYNHKPRVQKLPLPDDPEVFASQLRTPLDLNPGLPLRQIVIWARSIGANFSPAFYVPTCEWVMIFAKERFRLRDRSASAAGDVWTIPPESGKPHPAPFPLKLPLRALETTGAELVFDPFMGLGTTGEACARLGRRFVGVDIEESYCEYAVARILRAKGVACALPRLSQAATAPGPLFEAFAEEGR